MINPKIWNPGPALGLGTSTGGSSCLESRSSRLEVNRKKGAGRPASHGVGGRGGCQKCIVRDLLGVFLLRRVSNEYWFRCWTWHRPKITEMEWESSFMVFVLPFRNIITHREMAKNREQNIYSNTYVYIGTKPRNISKWNNEHNRN